MSVDIYGLKQYRRLTNIFDKTECEINTDFQIIIDKPNVNKKEPGVYFGRSYWEWRPIRGLIEKLNTEQQLGWTERQLNMMCNNDGFITADIDLCINTAEALNEVIANMEQIFISKIYMISSSWNEMLDGKQTYSGIPSSIKDELHAKYGQAGTVSFEKDFTVDELYYYEPSHSCDITDLKAFSVFLMNCEGFRID
jgi:hypothetical protein